MLKKLLNKYPERLLIALIAYSLEFIIQGYRNRITRKKFMPSIKALETDIDTLIELEKDILEL